MDTPKRSSVGVSGTITSQKKNPTDIEKLPIEKGHDNPNKSSHQILENGTSKLQNNSKQSRSSIQDDRTLNPEALTATERGKEYKSTAELCDGESLNRKSFDDGKICYCVSHSTRSAGEKKFDEMMDYALQNLGEAGKALTNLGDNFEHDLKLMFMDIMTRVQHWVNVAQNRLHAAKADLEAMHKDSMTRVSDFATKDLELVELRQKLCQTEAKLTTLEKQRTEMLSHAAKNSTEATQAGDERVSASVQAAIDKNTVKTGSELQNSSTVTVNTGCQCRIEKETIVNREAELEAELALLLEENERLMNERAEYENAIHCALLRGVSSLNVETLRVLRCPPIPCAVSTSRSGSPESTVLCRPRTTRCNVKPQPVQRGSKSAGKNSRGDKNGTHDSNDCCQPISEHLLCCNGRSNQAPIFFLHHGDAANPCRPCTQPRYPIAAGTPSTKGTVCIGGKCKKPVTTNGKEKISGRTIRSSETRSASYDVCVRNKDEVEENGIAKKTTALLAAKRYGTCNIKNRRNKDD